jgi:hypothetical protein
VTIAVLGAAGVVGSGVAHRLLLAGQQVVPIVRDPQRGRDRLEELRAVARDTVRGIGDLAPVRVADAAEPGSLVAALDGVTLLVSAVGPARHLGAGVLEAALTAGVHLVDVGGSPPYLRLVLEERAEQIARRGLTVVPGAGTAPLVGDLLAAVAADLVEGAREVHVAYALPGGAHLGDATPGVRASLAAAVGQPILAVRDGQLVEELPGEERRLAWFPRPVGPHHAAATGGGEPLTVPRHVPGLRTVRSYLAMPSWRAELVQLQANAARWDQVRRRLVARVERDRPAPSAARRAGLRWGAVAEVAGTDAVARAWAYGHDPYELAVRAVVEVVAHVRSGRAPVGVLAPAQVGEPRRLLDALSAVTDLRWSTARSEGPPPPG